MKVKVALIGYGYWSQNYARILSNHPFAELVCICESNEVAFNKAKADYPNIHVMIDYLWITGYDCDAVIVCTPITTHFKIVADFVGRKHVLCEKAFTQTPEQAESIIRRNDGKYKIAVGHTYEYNTIVREIKRMIDVKELGDIYYVSMTRVGMSPTRSDCNCIVDLMTHDISMLLYWFDEMPKSVSAFGKSYLKDGLEDIAVVNFEFSKNVMVTAKCSWLNPVKRRTVNIVGSKKMLVFDDVEKSLVVYYKEGEHKIDIEYKEPLKEQVDDFINSILEDREPFVNGQRGLNVVKVLNQCQQTLNEHRRIKNTVLS